jgi:hypothetical protein
MTQGRRPASVVRVTRHGAAVRTPPDIERIRVRAHQIWEEQGRPEGRDKENWQEAERQLQIEFRIGFPDDLDMNTDELAKPGDLDIDQPQAH